MCEEKIEKSPCQPWWNNQIFGSSHNAWAYKTAFLLWCIEHWWGNAYPGWPVVMCTARLQAVGQAKPSQAKVTAWPCLLSDFLGLQGSVWWTNCKKYLLLFSIIMTFQKKTKKNWRSCPREKTSQRHQGLIAVFNNNDILWKNKKISYWGLLLSVCSSRAHDIYTLFRRSPWATIGSVMI